MGDGTTKLEGELERRPQLYFYDGDVVLSAKVVSTIASDSPPRYQLYRVHKPVLSHNSPVLANLFADAAPADVYDGAPLVEMIRDSADALASLFAFIYDPSQLDVRRWDPDAPLAVSTTVRIANKCLVDRLSAYVVSKVKQNWPPTLEDWDRRKAEIEAMNDRLMKATSGEREASSKPLAEFVPEPASTIRFALQFGCPEILPAALYQLARTDTYDWDKPYSYDAHQDLPACWSLLEALNASTGQRWIQRSTRVSPSSPPWSRALFATYRLESRISEGNERLHPRVREDLRRLLSLHEESLC